MSESEQKSFAATVHKLKKQREKGRIAKSADFSSVTGYIVGATSLLFTYHILARGIFDSFQIANTAALNAGVENFFGIVLSANYRSGVYITVWMIVVMSAAIVANLIYNKGVIFSFEPIKPKFTNLNPAEGFKKIFGLRSLSDAGQAITRTVVWFGLCGIIVWMWITEILMTPLCGACGLNVAGNLFEDLVYASMIVAVIAAAADMLIQRSVFLHEMRMTPSERKREIQEQHGNPQIRREIKRRGRNPEGASRIGTEHATVVIHSNSVAVGVRYNEKEKPYPYIVATARGADALKIRSQAQKHGIAIEEDQAIADDIANIPINSPLPEKYYRNLASMMIRNRISIT